MSVTVIIPTTWKRKHFHQVIYNCYRNQTYKNKKLIVFEDQENTEPSEFWLSVVKTDGSVFYMHEKKTYTIGAKRNKLIEKATTEYIAHFDDDDIYMPNYLEVMMNYIGDAYFCKLLSWLNYMPNMSLFNKYVNLNPSYRSKFDYLYHKHDGIYYYRRTGRREDPDTYLEFGFSYLYKRCVYPEISFPDINLGEDYEFAYAIKKKHSIKLIENISEPIVIKRQFQFNTSISWPNLIIPKKMIEFVNKIQIYHNNVFVLSDLPVVSKKNDMNMFVKDDNLIENVNLDISCQDAR